MKNAILTLSTQLETKENMWRGEFTIVLLENYGVARYLRTYLGNTIFWVSLSLRPGCSHFKATKTRKYFLTMLKLLLDCLITLLI